MSSILSNSKLKLLVKKYINEQDTAYQKPAKSYIYFIRIKDTTKIKIGYCSGNPSNRLSALQVGSPEELKLAYSVYAHTSIVKYVEDALHGLLGGYAIRGEWFDIPDSVIYWYTQILEKELRSINKYIDGVEDEHISQSRQSIINEYESRTTDSVEIANLTAEQLLDNIDMLLSTCGKQEFWNIYRTLRDSVAPRVWRGIEYKFKTHKIFTEFRDDARAKDNYYKFGK